MYVWHEGLTPEEEAYGAYWERNMLALFLAIQSNKAWNSFVTLMAAQGKYDEAKHGKPLPSGWYKHTGEGFEGWSRVISLYDGKYTFHVPDDFDLGDLPEIEPNWDGHTTEQKWSRVMLQCGIDIDK